VWWEHAIAAAAVLGVVAFIFLGFFLAWKGKGGCGCGNGPCDRDAEGCDGREQADRDDQAG